MKRKTIKKMEGGVGTAGISKLRRRNIEIAETVTTTTPEALTEPKKRGGGMLDFLRKKKGNDVTSAQDVQATEQATAAAALIEPAPAPVLESAVQMSKKKFIGLKDDLKSGNMLDSCLNLKTIEGCKTISSYDITNPTTEQTKRITKINEISNRCLLTIANQNNKLKSEYNENKKERLEKLFKNLLHGFIKKFFKDINEQVTNIENPPDIDDENYKNGIKFVENYINSFYSNGIAIVGNDVKYYKLTDGKYTNYKYDIKYGKLTKFLFVIINNKNILIHQIFQQIIYGLIDTITKDDVIFNKYYSL